MVNELDTEQRILESARNVFMQKGFDGARMQEIADSAGINKALLHYYFRSKDKLFEKIFADSLKKLFPLIGGFISGNQNIFEKIKQIVSMYIDFICENPFVPLFVIHELNKNPDRIIEFVDGITGIVKSEKFKIITAFIEKEIKEGKIRSISPQHLIINTISLSVFPFLSKPLIKRVFMNNNDEMFDKFIKERKVLVADFIINAIKV